MQIDKRHSSTEFEEEDSRQEPSAGMVNFPIWIDEPVQNSPLVHSPSEQEQLEIVEMLIRAELDENTASTLSNAPSDAGVQRSFQKRHHVPNPATPIPPRASANPSGAIWIRPRYPYSRPGSQEEDVTRIPTIPQPTIWEHESYGYKAASSLSSLSLVVSDNSSPAARPPSIDELDTLPSSGVQAGNEVRSAHTSLPEHHYYGLQLPVFDITKVSTTPPLAESLTTQKLRDEYYTAPPDIDDFIEADTILSSAIALDASPYPAREEDLLSQEGNSLVSAGISRRGKRREYRPSFALHPMDRIRWWLLYPGRLELLLWIVGTALLVVVTCVLIFVTTISLGIVSIGHTDTTRSSSTSTAQCAPESAANCDTSSASSSSGLKITLLNTTALLTSTPVHLHGQGFDAGDRVTFTYDNNQSCHPGTLQADEHGEFTVDLTLVGKPSLHPGPHRLQAYDENRKQAISLTILFTADTALKTPTNPLPMSSIMN